MMPTIPFPSLDGLAPGKALIARRLLLGGEPIDAARFAARGLALSKADLAVLAAFEAEGLHTGIAERVVSADGSVRLVLSAGKGDLIETVAMPVGAACISTQVGCAVRCAFCASGRDGLVRNLDVVEIVEQLVHARRQMRIDRVVFMGMGEPTHNLDNVLAAAARFRHDGLIGYRRQTLSTVGSRRAFARMLEAEVKPALALSLHSADAVTRRRLMPHAYDEPLAELIAGADDYARRIGNPVQIEWTLLAGVNDRDADVDALAALVRGVYGYVNFIVWNQVDGSGFAAPERERVVEIVRRTKRHGLLATMRISAGADVDAACGQLRRRVAADV
ncbi:MAG: radical SAM protein [Planctomycetota bacterium]